MQFNQPQLEKRPSEIQIRDCAEQLRSQGRSNYGDSVKKYAQLRLADLVPLLEDWQNETYAAALKQTTLPKIAAAINAKLSPAQCEKLLAVLQQFSEQGNTTAMLYLAYLYSQGIHTESSLRKTAHYLQLAASKKDWRANHLWAELLVVAPLAARDLIGDEIQADVEKWHAEMPCRHEIRRQSQARCRARAGQPHRRAAHQRLNHARRAATYRPSAAIPQNQSLAGCAIAARRQHRNR